MTLPELKLWQVLRQRPESLKFRRQHPCGRYIADFYCHEARLVIEVDGEAHNRGHAPARDKQRDEWFAQRGLHVLHIPAATVLKDFESAFAAISAKASELIGED
jgi:very-short-patch-repair endonuclease